ncbi:expressed protein [Batrachochytrium dendrobatidis JAM81]|uniref:Expressed protein n=1 Tax=Batrachochytrium dendrobatidis (strain JAM81 / FGSC 10211) TaxID=684364 RepID=F4P133_BATDJ|nr:uncharacterized protein BATDEDRAFT_34999 [Batrachochytrium dendrobatidis JAM81]EGF80988.1 expressed protein [Batrachochytrium dendrobatidis JAM81]|eukprot:XP_006678583.1 expressed protein [Batrachochytrium dendrobatidis JAM81]
MLFYATRLQTFFPSQKLSFKLCSLSHARLHFITTELIKPLDRSLWYSTKTSIKSPLKAKSKYKSFQLKKLLPKDFKPFPIPKNKKIRWTQDEDQRLMLLYATRKQKLSGFKEASQTLLDHFSAQFPNRTTAAVTSRLYYLRHRFSTISTKLNESEVKFVYDQIDLQKLEHQAHADAVARGEPVKDLKVHHKRKWADGEFRPNWEAIARRLGRRGAELKNQIIGLHSPATKKGPHSKSEVDYMVKECKKAAKKGEQVNWTECGRHLNRLPSRLFNSFSKLLY